MKKLFLPAGARVEEDTVVLSTGDVVPKWVCVAVPTLKLNPRPLVTGITKSTRREWIDVLTGAVTSERAQAKTRDGVRGERSFGDYDFTGFSRTIARDDINDIVQRSLPRKPLVDASIGEDPGYYEQLDSLPRDTEAVTVGTDEVITGETDLGAGYVVSDALIWEGRPQELVAQQGNRKQDVVLNMRHVAVNVLGKIDAENTYLSGYDVQLRFRPRSWFVDDNYWAPDSASYDGSCVRVEFDGSRELIYKKAVDMASKLSFDDLFLDYRSDGRVLITVISKIGSNKRRVGTRYDDLTISTNKLICASGDPNVQEDRVTSSVPTEAEVQPHSDDDYYSLYVAIKNNPDVFGGVQKAQQLLQQLGFPSNPTLSGLAGFGAGAGTAATAASPEAMSKISDTIQCPPVSKDKNVFPTSQHPAMRGLNDVSQLDDTQTQDRIPFSLRTNNPLKVKTVKGVTDLKTRFGYLGEAEGHAVYRDHVGGAAAGLAYLMTMSGGTIGQATNSVLGGSSPSGSDVTSVTPSKVYQSVTKAMFGVGDPTGSLQECATVKSDDKDSLVTLAASMAASLANSETSPLTHAEWMSAYQIAKNEANEHLKKTTTGVDLPAQEDDDSQVQPVGSQTKKQGKEAHDTVDQERADKEKWNPLTNFAHYSQNVWGDSGSKWISRSLITYEQKSGEEDKIKIAKRTDQPQLDQDTKTYSTDTDLDWA